MAAEVVLNPIDKLVVAAAIAVDRTQDTDTVNFTTRLRWKIADHFRDKGYRLYEQAQAEQGNPETMRRSQRCSTMGDLIMGGPREGLDYTIVQ